ncbi:MAG: hypothetical protein CSA68_07495 [Rhodobacterales bacterium]|nr:MAG: hypothetical protein CSA68_07495 [Rhodobacterales bacterium]
MTDNGLVAVFAGMKDQIALLAFSGVGGAFFRVVLAPEGRWKRRIIQGVAGSLSAVFLGGVLAHVIDNITGAGALSYLAGGFLMGSGGEVAVKALQDRLLAKK